MGRSMALFIPCSMVAGRMQVLMVPRAPGVRVLSFQNRHKALEVGNAIVANSWVFCDHENDYTMYDATGEDDVTVWETELDELVAAGVAVGPWGFGVDSCVFRKDTMLVSVVESIDVEVELDMGMVATRLEALKDSS